MSPPSASAASSAAIIRSASGASLVAKARAMASQTVSFSMRLAWQLNPSPSVWPAAGMHRAPVCAATLPAASTMAHWRTSGFRVAGGQGRERLLGGVAGLQELETQRAVAEVDVRLRRHRADSGLGPRHGRADLEVVRLHGDSELAGLLVTRDDGVGQGALS